LRKSPLLVDETPINPVQSVRDLGIFIDADLVMRSHVQKTVSWCSAVLRQLRSIRHSVPATTFQTLIVSLSRLDYGNAVLAGLPAYLFRRLQSVMNAAAWLIYGLRHSDHISDALISLHWLRAQERVRFTVPRERFLPRDAMHPRYYGHGPVSVRPSVCPSVRHKSVFY